MQGLLLKNLPELVTLVFPLAKQLILGVHSLLDSVSCPLFPEFTLYLHLLVGYFLGHLLLLLFLSVQIGQIRVSHRQFLHPDVVFMHDVLETPCSFLACLERIQQYTLLRLGQLQLVFQTPLFDWLHLHLIKIELGLIYEH